MKELVAQTVQVVTTGVDWPAIAAAISGGLVGLGGIIATVRQSTRSIAAQDARMRRADKRNLYASCLAALVAFMDASYYANKSSGLSPEKQAQLLDDMVRAQLAAANTTSAVDLVAPEEISKVVHVAMSVLLDANHSGKRDKIPAAITDLTLAMRADVNEVDKRDEKHRRKVAGGFWERFH